MVPPVPDRGQGSSRSPVPDRGQGSSRSPWSPVPDRGQGSSRSPRPHPLSPPGNLPLPFPLSPWHLYAIVPLGAGSTYCRQFLEEGDDVFFARRDAYYMPIGGPHGSRNFGAEESPIFPGNFWAGWARPCARDPPLPSPIDTPLSIPPYRYHLIDSTRSVHLQ